MPLMTQCFSLWCPQLCPNIPKTSAALYRWLNLLQHTLHCSIRPNHPFKTFFKSFHSKSRIPIWPKTDIQKIILRATIINWQKNVLVSYLFLSFHLLVQTITDPSTYKWKYRNKSKTSCQSPWQCEIGAVPFPVGHSWCLAHCFWFFHACDLSLSTAVSTLLPKL